MIKRNLQILLTILLLGVIHSSALAAEADLLDKCRAAERVIGGIESGDELNAGYCIGLIEGVISAMAYHNDLLPAERRLCLPKQEVSIEEKVKIVVQYIQEQSATAGLDDGVLVYRALEESFTCRQDTFSEIDEELIGSLGFAAMSMDAYYEICRSPKDSKVNTHLNDVKELVYDKLKIFYSDVEERLEKNKNRNYYKESREYVNFLINKFGGCKSEGMAGWFKVLEDQYSGKLSEFRSKYK